MPARSFLFNLPPHWTTHHLGTHCFLPKNVQSWVYETNSLTQRLRRFYGNGVTVEVLFQQWHKPFLTESQSLNLVTYRYCLIREVLLHIEDKPLILARTVLPQTTIVIAHRKLSNLGTRPLGEVIFSYPNLARLQTEICRTVPPMWSSNLKQRIEIKGKIYGRRTVYAIEQQPLLVSEFFMPDALLC